MAIHDHRAFQELTYPPNRINVSIVHDGFHPLIMNRVRLFQVHFILEETWYCDFYSDEPCRSAAIGGSVESVEPAFQHR